MRRVALGLFVIIAAALLPACSIRPEVTVETTGSGTVSMRIRLEKVFVDYLNDLAELTGDAAGGRIFKVEDIRKSFAERNDLELRRIESPSPDVLDMEIAFDSIETVFAREEKLQEAGIVSFARVPEGYAIRFHLDRGNFGDIQEFLPFLKNPLFDGLAPQEGDVTTEAEYLEMIDLALGEEGSAALKASTIETRVTVKGTLVSQQGGSVSGNTVTFSIPLLRVLLLDEPLDYSIVFR
ncbi:MAG: hypothetical protein JW820_06880 [Spirochaetales bacterium]|nr:hypothetical protein [Spirochaetales bacterium]